MEHGDDTGFDPVEPTANDGLAHRHGDASQLLDKYGEFIELLGLLGLCHGLFQMQLTARKLSETLVVLVHSR